MKRYGIAGATIDELNNKWGIDILPDEASELIPLLKRRAITRVSKGWGKQQYLQVYYRKRWRDVCTEDLMRQVRCSVFATDKNLEKCDCFTPIYGVRLDRNLFVIINGTTDH